MADRKNEKQESPLPTSLFVIGNYNNMNFLKITLLILLISCRSGINESKNIKYVEAGGEYISVKIPIQDTLKFYYSDFVFGDGNDDFTFIDSTHHISILISPTPQAAVKNFIWTRSEEEHLMYSISKGHLLPKAGNFEIPLQNVIGLDSSYSSSLIYHTDVRLASGQNIKAVEFVKYIETKKGWCKIQIFRNYTKFSILNDIDWSKSFDGIEITIKKEFRG